MSDSDKLIAEEKAKRKELARVRVFWFLVVSISLLIIYIAIQIVMLLGNN